MRSRAKSSDILPIYPIKKNRGLRRKAGMPRYLGMMVKERGILFKEFSVTHDWRNLISTNIVTTKYYLFLSLVFSSLLILPLPLPPAQIGSFL